MSLPPLLPLAVREAEKDRFGEVFTPPALINAMLDKLPPSVWTDPAKKWLDPAAGFGNFFMEVYPRLMKSLEHVISEPAQRRHHILTQMLYMVEYNEESCQRIRENPMFIAEAGGVNLICGSFLDLDPLNPVFRFGTTAFDIIVGNPPFNADQTHEGKKGGGANLWPKFVEKSLRGGSLLKPDGFLLFVHPALWRKPPSPRAPTLFELMTHENHMLYLEIHNKPDGKRVFGVQTRYDFYVIQKRKPTPGVSTSTTFIKDQNGQEHPSFDLSPWKFLPNHSYEIIEPLLRSPDNTSEPIVIFSRGRYGTDKPWVHEKQRTPEDIPLIHSTPLSGPRFLWSDPRVKCEDVEDCAPMVGVPKVIFGESGINKVVIDVEGRYGMTQGAIGLRIPSVSPDEQNAEARQMATALESDIFSRILDAMSFSNFRIDWRMFLYLRADFYKHPMFLDALPHVRPSFTIQQRPDVRNHLLRPSVKSTEEEAKKTDVKQDVVVRDVE
ncbi:MAG: hypothetical protein FJX80_01190 [Bacteroidetes bacterium]|nr:hypothetical protein [Bacteroidota bacterium]